MLESGEFASAADLAEHEGIGPSYVTRLPQLTLLSPDLVEAILDCKQGRKVEMAHFLESVAVDWTQQHVRLG